MTADSPERLVGELRQLAATDPLQARKALAKVFDGPASEIESLLTKASVPGDGRLRQVIANLIRQRGELKKYASRLQAWRDVEPDEFTKRSLDAALAGVVSRQEVRDKRPALVDRYRAEAYRHVSDRLKHQLRNALMDPMGHLIRLRDEVNELEEKTTRDALSAHVAGLQDALARIGHIVAFDPDDGHFKMRSVSLPNWLNAFSEDYASHYKPLKLRLLHDDAGYIILGSDYLLRTVFWNLWMNAQQAAGSACVVTVAFATAEGRLELKVSDSGEGFSRDLAESGVPDVQPREGHRGRGLLEVQAAMDELLGDIELYLASDGSYRLKLTFPRGS